MKTIKSLTMTAILGLTLIGCASEPNIRYTAADVRADYSYISAVQKRGIADIITEYQTNVKNGMPKEQADKIAIPKIDALFARIDQMEQAVEKKIQTVEEQLQAAERRQQLGAALFGLSKGLSAAGQSLDQQNYNSMQQLQNNRTIFCNTNPTGAGGYSTKCR